MPAKKRPTTPKIKGCYECSQRRISCDRAEPHCKKCTIKGLQCSGLGIRYRFNHGMSSRGKFIGKSINDILARPQSTSLPKDPDGKGFDEQCHDLAEVAKNTSCQPSLACEDITGLSNQVIKRNTFNSELEGQEGHQFFSLHTYEVSSGLIGDPTRGHLDLVPGWKRCLLNYFSENIAPAMVAIDDKFNGYRTLLLPVAELDESVMNAVLSASAYHISHKSAKYSSLAQSFYTNAIRGLIARMDKYIADANSIQDNFNLLTILVLLVTAMITGEADFPLLFNLLKIGLRDIGGESSLGSSPLDRFILRQTRKLQLYAEPLLDEEEGARIVTTKLQEGLDCLHYCAEIHPEHSSAMLYISDLIQQACSIYLGRALDTLTPSMSITLVDNFIAKYKAFPEGDPGSHVLVWALFVVAAESSTPEQKSFFAKEFQDFYLWGGFANNIKAVSLLEKLWAATSSQRWTSLLPQGQVFIM